MAESRPFRVIIGGGGISGLTLANALEKANIDYVLLEGRDSIAPQVGASIGIFANGGRILDQLGCYATLEKQTVPLNLYHNRYENGTLIYTSDTVPLTTKRYVITIALGHRHSSGLATP
jgi:2-polyprenyl-6-methoxyphenol hydroxylase-like FAD-dependent oxidoreductase